MLCSAIPRIFDKIDKLQRMVNGEESAEVSFISFFSFSFFVRRSEKRRKLWRSINDQGSFVNTNFKFVYPLLSLSLSNTHTHFYISLTHTHTHNTQHTSISLCLHTQNTHYLCTSLPNPFVLSLFSLLSLFLWLRTFFPFEEKRIVFLETCFSVFHFVFARVRLISSC